MIADAEYKKGPKAPDTAMEEHSMKSSFYGHKGWLSHQRKGDQRLWSTSSLVKVMLDGPLQLVCCSLLFVARWVPLWWRGEDVNMK